MAKNGRPEIPINLADVERLASRGLNEEQIAGALGIARNTLRKRKNDYASFLTVLERGKERGVAAVANHLYEQSKGGSTSASIFYLKNRAKWSDNYAIAHGGGDKPIEQKITIEFVGADDED